ncbi:MAG: glycosyltransferase family 4 protein [Nitrososphaerota archaeon]
MRIALLHPSLAIRGGSEKVAIYQAKKLKEKGFDIILLTPFIDKKSTYNELFKDVTIEKLGLTIPVPIAKRSINFLKILHYNPNKLKNFDLLLAHASMNILAYRVKNKCNTPYISYIHHPYTFLYKKGFGYENERKKLMGILLYPPFSWLCSLQKYKQLDFNSIINSNFVFVNSKKIKNDVEKIYRIKNLEVCYPALDDKYHNVKVNFSIKKNSLLFTSRHIKQKMLHIIPDILVNINNKDVMCYITGKEERPYTSMVKEKAKKLGVLNRMIFLGSINEEELLELYLKCKVLIYPAISEDFGLSPIEGMATGCLPIAWKDGGGVEETIINGKTGFLAKAYDLNDYIERVKSILENSKMYEEMCYKAKNESLKFNWNIHIEKIISKIEKVCAKN